MDGISAASASSLQQAALAQAQIQNQMDIAVLQKSQEVAQQQASAAVQLIEAAADAIVDVKA